MLLFRPREQHWPRYRGRNYRGPSQRTRAFSLVDLKAAKRTEAGPVVVKLGLKWNTRVRSTETGMLTSGFSIFAEQFKVCFGLEQPRSFSKSQFPHL